MTKNITIFILSFAVFLTACNTGKKSEITAENLAIGVMSSMDYLPLAIAQSNGYFSENGVEVTIQKFYSPNERDAALQSNNLDGTILDYTGGAIQNSGGIPLRFASQCDATFELIVGKKSGINTISDLKDKKIAVSRNTVIDFCTDLAVEKAGLSLQDVEKPEINKIPLRLEMLRNAKIDASMLPDPFATIAKNEGNKSVISMVELDVRVTGIAFLQKTIDEKPEALKKFYRAYNKAIEDLKTKPIENFQTILTEEVGFPLNLVSEIKLPNYFPAQLPQEADLLLVEKWLKERSLVKPDFDIKTIIVSDLIP
ncbi:MAG: MetQ/NlpA family ABC transporter substrate-binding protein [Bacteroidia bacterium]|nr:MetQ/NlpA family ABC transporter substrate-binding protein [Bacteroidia bacterium]